MYNINFAFIISYKNNIKINEKQQRPLYFATTASLLSRHLADDNVNISMYKIITITNMNQVCDLDMMLNSKTKFMNNIIL